MKVSLRKANMLQNTLNELVKESTEISSVVDVMTQDNWETELDNVRNEYFEEVESKLILTKTRYNIRQQIAEKNAECGINTMLCDVANIDTQINLLNSLILNQSVRDNSNVIQKRIDRNEEQLKKENSNYLGRSVDSMKISVLEKSDINNYKNIVRSLKKERVKLNDKILSLNIKTELELSLEIEYVLSDNNLD
jgi:uncharacterized protein YdcH (DUF465 family)